MVFLVHCSRGCGLPKLTRKGNLVLDRDRAFDIAAGIMAVVAYSENPRYIHKLESGDFDELRVRGARRFANT
jgi:hypothetical protein